ncbi:DUF5615 family PIN-like protein [Nocardia sp. NPDC050435]|uniref:DUF5615 family PIN-like protein n=1 Tax=Nocardia sp. NPDC050435 TaxID=3155040 RepID=UPI0034079C0E
MRFLVDAQLPRKLATFLAETGHDVVHTSELDQGNRTPDSSIAEIADREGRVVVTKDNDFWIGHVLDGCPSHLLIVTTGNIANRQLIELFAQHLDEILCLFGESVVVELGRDQLISRVERTD